jgi:hypothetical protein
MDFIKKHNLEQMKEAIKHNFNYFCENDPINYQRITDFYNTHKLWGIIDVKNKNYELIDNNAQALIEHQEDFEWLYNRLGDYRSKRILVNVFITG